ncbi:hypothetical protein BpHYR1_035842 [Brachionus plicatilis]|uniref:Uncharacterized protein n=1 Tax=Brachionus plicatilis TaxID=10195 RepID=A0A3M7PUE9_BRAPC|nr:hypothetical protein BpHYR1_035842 [Brachionus plicatilis]
MLEKTKPTKRKSSIDSLGSIENEILGLMYNFLNVITNQLTYLCISLKSHTDTSRKKKNFTIFGAIVGKAVSIVVVVQAIRLCIVI